MAQGGQTRALGAPATQFPNSTPPRHYLLPRVINEPLREITPEYPRASKEILALKSRLEP